MKIINVIEQSKGSINHISSFCVSSPSQQRLVVDKAEKLFREILSAKTNMKDEEIDLHIDEGLYEDQETGYILSIMFSDVVV